MENNSLSKETQTAAFCLIYTKLVLHNLEKVFYSQQGQYSKRVRKVFLVRDAKLEVILVINVKKMLALISHKKLDLAMWSIRLDGAISLWGGRTCIIGTVFVSHIRNLIVIN